MPYFISGERKLLSHDQLWRARQEDAARRAKKIKSTDLSPPPFAADNPTWAIEGRPPESYPEDEFAPPQKELTSPQSPAKTPSKRKTPSVAQQIIAGNYDFSPSDTGGPGGGWGGIINAICLLYTSDAADE